MVVGSRKVLRRDTKGVFRGAAQFLASLRRTFLFGAVGCVMGGGRINYELRITDYEFGECDWALYGVTGRVD